MVLTFPCEFVSWNVLPAMRREITIYLIGEKEISRKKVAEKLGLTEAAVCQYLKKKRGGSHKFGKNDLGKIRKMADAMMKSDKGFDGMCVICKELDVPHEKIKAAKA